MTKDYQKNFFKRLFSSRVFLFFVGLTLIWLGVNLGRESYRKYQLTKELDSLRQEIETLQQSNDELASLIEFYQQQSYLEKEARLKLNLKQPGEKVVIVPEAEAPDSNEEEPKEEKEEAKESNWWKWWEYFFGGE